MKVFISALRRSGSTIFWRCFRETSVATSFDEPFNPKLTQLPKEHVKGTMKELISLLHDKKSYFWDMYSPIYPQDELKDEFTNEQSDYLSFLLSLNESVVIDSTRCWHKLASLQKILGSDAYFIHLHRAPASWVTSHMLPSEQMGVRYFRLNYCRKKNFWTRKTDFNRWKLEDVLGRELLSPFHLVFLKNDRLAQKFYESSAVSRLLKFWSLAFEEVEQKGKTLFGERFISIRFEDFCMEPVQTLQHISQKTGLLFNFEEMPVIKSPSSAFLPSNKEWKNAAQYWNLPNDSAFLHRRR